MKIKGLPIQCVEAVFLGVYLTSTFKEVERIPVSFKSKLFTNTIIIIIIIIKNKVNLEKIFIDILY